MVGAGGADKGGGGRRRDTQNLDYVLRSMLAGGLAGSAAKTAVAPLDRVKILFQTNNKKYNRHAGTFLGVFRAVGEIGRESGVRGLFQGNSATLMRIFPYAAIKFMAYEQFKTILMPTKSKETPLRGFAAGSLAGLTTVLVTYPLELIRVRLAFDTTHAKSPGVIGTMREIWNESRLPAAPSASGTPSAARPTAVQQTAGAGVAAHLTEPAPAVTAGRFAGNPVLPAEGGSFVQRLPASFHRHFPLMNFYRGFMPTVLGILPYAGSSFVIYSHLTKLCASWLGLASEKELRGWWTLASGGAAGAAAQTVAYPAEVVRRRMQVSGALDPHRFVRISDTCRDVLRERGPRGFFVGLSIGYLKVAPMSAISFLVYEEMKVLLKIS